MTGLTKHNLFVERLMEKTKYDFSKSILPKKFASKICNKDFTLQ